MADYVSGEDQPYDDRHTPRPVDHGTQPCGNAWYAPWPASGRCTYVYGSGGDRCSFVNGDAHHNHRTATGLGYAHQDQWRPVQTAEHTPQPGGPGMQPCGNTGPFAGMTCDRSVGHSGTHERTTAGLKMVWSDVTDESVAKQLAGLQRKVRAQANQINKLEELRRAAVDKQPEYQAAKRDLASQASLTTRAVALARQVETERDRDRERRTELIGNLILDIRRALGYPVPDKVTSGSATWSALRRHVGLLCSVLPKSDSTESAERTRRFVARFYRLASLLGVDTAGETWDTLLQRVADLRTELEVERVRANARKAKLDKQGAARLFMGPSAEYGTDPVAARVIELAKKLDQLDREVVQRCESRHGDRRCVSYTGHNGAHHAGPGAERWDANGHSW